MALVAATAAHGADFSRVGAVMRLSGALGYGAQYEFKAFVAAQPSGAIRVVDLDSNGGSLDAATDIARLIREKGWITQVDAGRSRCLSACTILFAAGVRRHYLNADRLRDGLAGPREARGLGYHGASGPSGRHVNGYSGNGTAALIALYYELGSAAAADLVNHAPPGGIFLLSGGSALARGIATSLGRP